METRIVNRQSYIHPDGSLKYLYSCDLDNKNPKKVVQLFSRNDHPDKLDYDSLRHWKFDGSAFISTCPHCSAQYIDLIAAARWHSFHPLRWIAECPGCRGWSVFTSQP